MSEKNEKLRQLNPEEMRTRLADAREELMNLRFQQATGELTDYTRLRQTRRQVARLITLLSEHERMVNMEGEA